MSKRLNLLPVHAGGRCRAAFMPDGSCALSCGTDAFVLAHDASKVTKTVHKPTRVARILDEQIESINAIAIAPNGWGFATGDDEGRVRLFSLPQEGSVDWDSDESGIQSVPFMVRFSGAIRALDFSPTGNAFIAAGEEPGVIKMINRTNMRNHTIFRGSGGETQEDAIDALAYDPLGDFIVSVGERGGVCVWSIGNQEVVTAVELGGKKATSVSWHPNGDSFVVGTEGGIQFISRDSWRVLSSGDVNSGQFIGAIVQSVDWSGSGEYVLCGDSSGQCMLIDAGKKTILDRWSADLPIQFVRWNPASNSFLALDNQGQACMFHDAVAEHMPKAYNVLPGGPQRKDARTTQPANMAGDSEDEEVKTPSRRKRLRKKEETHASEGSVVDDGSLSPYSLNEEAILEEQSAEYVGPRKSKSHKRQLAGHEIVSVSPFMPSATPLSSRSRKRIMCWNRTGVIVVFNEETHQSIEVDFNDQGKRPFRFIDHFDLSLGTMDEHGAVFACHAKEEHPSMVVYKPFESWTTNAEWSARLRQDERAEAVALGGHFVVVGTSKQLLRVFNLSGMETDVSSIEGSIISACASRDRLCTVSQSQFSGEVYVSVYVVDSDGHITRIHHSPPGVSPKASLQWIGLSQVENDLVVMDSRCTFHLLEEKQKKWILLAEKVNEKLDATAFWPVTVDSQTAIGVNLFGDEKYPSVVPRSPVTRVQFDPVTVEPSKTRRALFDQRRRLRILKGALERREASESFHRDYEEDDNLLEQFGKHKVDTEKAVLKAVEEACKLKNASRALELTNTLQEAWALKLSLRLAEHYHLDNLRERMRLSIQARVQAAEAAEERKPHLRGPQNRTEGADMEALIKRVDSEEHAPAENEDIATPKQAKGGSLSERFKRKTEQTRQHPKGGVRATT